MSGRQGNRPDRRIEPPGSYCAAVLDALSTRIRYDGEGHHKLHPGDYGFHPPSNPRPDKNVCDDKRPVLKREAQALFASGVRKGLVSRFPEDGMPKYIWAVDPGGDAWEAKVSKAKPGCYHGYRLPEDDPQRSLVIKAWKTR